MRRTATHVLSSPNPAQLEMRILANHGADPRFAFLRGRWARAWRVAKSKIKLEFQEAERKRAEKDNDQKGGGMGGLAGYGSDSGEDESEGGQDASANVEAQKEAAQVEKQAETERRRVDLAQQGPALRFHKWTSSVSRGTRLT